MRRNKYGRTLLREPHAIVRRGEAEVGWVFESGGIYTFDAAHGVEEGEVVASTRQLIEAALRERGLTVEWVRYSAFQ